MPGQQPPTEIDLFRLARQHAESLRAAGVEWLPVAKEPLSSPAPPQPNNLPPAPAAPPARLLPQESSLFQEKLPDAGGPEQRRHELQVLAGRVAGCMRCSTLCSTRTQTVFGVGPIDPELCFVGEAPGADEDRLGEPFVGAAGQLLNRIIAACGMKREEVYICNILRCRPPGNRTPNADEAANCREFLEKQLELIRPKFICALGGCAAQNLLNTTDSLGKMRRRFHDYRGIPVLCTYHPAFLLPHRSPDKKKDVWEDMKLLLAKMGRTVPQK
jgi:DNA polymerase